MLENIFIKNNIKHKKEIRFNELEQKRFDNSILDKSSIVKFLFEYDGKQHFIPNSYFGGNDTFKQQKYFDNLKNSFCVDSNIPLLRIPYIYDAIKDTDKIEKIVLDFIKTKTVPREILDFYEQYDFSNYTSCVKKIEANLEKRYQSQKK